MEIKRAYGPKEINWKLVPDLVTKIEKSITGDELREKNAKLQPRSLYQIETYSQRVAIHAAEEFLRFVRGSPEAAIQVRVTLECLRVTGAIDPYIINPPYFSLESNSSRVRVHLYRTETETALRLMRELEETLELSPAAPPSEEQPGERPRPMKRTVFIAHAFTDAGRSYAFQLTKFLSLLGFEVATGEGYAPERVSSKVKRRLTAQEVVIAVLSKQQDSTWLVQELSGAEFVGKPIMLLVEEGTDFRAGVLGDLEYIRFREGSISETFAPMLEGLRELAFEFR
jgi:hypothetical protein